MAEDINEQPKGLWHNIRAKRARGEKPAQKGTKMYKDVQKAMKKINAEEGLWSNINAKKKSGKKSARKGSKAYKAAVKAGDKLEKGKKESIESVNEMYDEYDTSGISRSNLKSFLNYLDDKDISYSMERDTIEFDVTELDRKGQKIVAKLFESVNEAIKYKKGKTYQTGSGWTVYMSDGSASFDIKVNNSAGWSTDPHDRRGETLRLLDAGKTVATLRFKEGNINALAKKMHDLTSETTWGEKEGLKAKDYADIIRVWIDMGMEMNESINEGNPTANKLKHFGFTKVSDTLWKKGDNTIEIGGGKPGFLLTIDGKPQTDSSPFYRKYKRMDMNLLRGQLKKLKESINEAKIKRGTKITYTKHFQFGKQGEESAKVVAIKGDKILLDNGDELNAVDIAMNRKDYKLETIDNNAGMPTQEQSLEEAGKPTFNKLDKVKVQNVSGPASKYNGMKGVVSTKPMSYSDGSYGYMVRLKRGRKVAELEFRENELVKETVTETRLTPSKYSNAQKAISKYVKAKADDYQILDPNRDGKRFDVGLHNTGINQKAMIKTLHALLKKLGHKKAKITAGEIFSDDGKYYEVSVDLNESNSNNLSAINDTVIVEEEGMACPIATQDVEVNTKQRDSAIAAEHIKYGPLNVNEPGDYWEKIADKWDTSVEAAKQSLCGNCVAFDVSPRMDECMPGETSDDDGRLGYCWMHHFKCHSARTCNTWAKGGPIGDNDISYDWQSRSKIDESKSTISHNTLIQIINEELDKVMNKKESVNEAKWKKLRNGDQYIGYSASKRIHYVKRKGKKISFNDTGMNQVYGLKWKDIFESANEAKLEKEKFTEPDQMRNEAARVDSSRYKRSHGKDPKGSGTWLFSFDEKGDDVFDVGGYMSYTAAKKLAAKKAKEAGKSYVYVMESNESNNMKENIKEDIAKIIREELANIIVNEDIRIDTAKDIKPSIVSFKDAHNINEDDSQLDQAFNDAEPVDEASPKMRIKMPSMYVDTDAKEVGDMISMLGAIGRRASGSNVKKDLAKAIKVLQNLRSSIKVGR